MALTFQRTITYCTLLSVITWSRCVCSWQQHYSRPVLRLLLKFLPSDSNTFLTHLGSVSDIKCLGFGLVWCGLDYKIASQIITERLFKLWPFVNIDKAVLPNYFSHWLYLPVLEHNYAKVLPNHNGAARWTWRNNNHRNDSYTVTVFICVGQMEVFDENVQKSCRTPGCWQNIWWSQNEREKKTRD